MNLKTYLDKHHQTISQFAASLGVAPSTISRIIDGTRNPSLSLIEAIKEQTDGHVKADDWLSESRTHATQCARAQ